MDEILCKWDPEKRDRVLNAAFEEFARKGYEDASTNEIVEKAGISKGLLFHYFGSKQKLYDTLCRFSVEYVMDLLESGIDWEERDLFRRVQQITELKLTAMEKYPHIYDFLKKIMENMSVEEMKSRFSQRMLNLIRRAYEENIDYSLFKEGIDIQKAVEIMQWTVEGAAAKLFRQQDLPMQEVITEHEKYMELLRQLMYRQ